MGPPSPCPLPPSLPPRPPSPAPVLMRPGRGFKRARRLPPDVQLRRGAGAERSGRQPAVGAVQPGGARCFALCCSPRIASPLLSAPPGCVAPRRHVARPASPRWVPRGAGSGPTGRARSIAPTRRDPLPVCSQAPSCSPAPCAGATARVSWPPSSLRLSDRGVSPSDRLCPFLPAGRSRRSGPRVPARRFPAARPVAAASGRESPPDGAGERCERRGRGPPGRAAPEPGSRCFPGAGRAPPCAGGGGGGGTVEGRGG